MARWYANECVRYGAKARCVCVWSCPWFLCCQDLDGGRESPVVEPEDPEPEEAAPEEVCAVHVCVCVSLCVSACVNV